MSETVNASLTEFSSSTEKNDDAEYVDNNNTGQKPGVNKQASTYLPDHDYGYNIGAFLGTLTVEQVNDVLNEFSDSDTESLTELLRKIPVDEECKNALETVSGLTTESKEAAINACDVICDYVGFDCISVSVTEPENKYQSPMITTTVSDIHLTQNKELNQQLLTQVLDVKGETKEEQEQTRSLWMSCIDTEALVEFKRGVSNPDALGFVLPQDVQANGADDNVNSVLDVKHIGESRAEEIHPTGDIMALQDFGELTEMQWEYVSYPTRKDGFESRFAPYTLRWVFDSVSETEKRINVISDLFNMHDSRGNDDSELAWVNKDMTVGITKPDCTDSYSLPLVENNAETIKTALNSETDIMVCEFGEDELVKKKIEKVYWDCIETVSDMTGSQILTHEDKQPVICQIGDGRSMIVAPRTD